MVTLTMTNVQAALLHDLLVEVAGARLANFSPREVRFADYAEDVIAGVLVGLADVTIDLSDEVPA